MKLKYSQKGTKWKKKMLLYIIYCVSIHAKDGQMKNNFK